MITSDFCLDREVEGAIVEPRGMARLAGECHVGDDDIGASALPVPKPRLEVIATASGDHAQQEGRNQHRSSGRQVEASPGDDWGAGRGARAHPTRLANEEAT